MIMRTVWFLIVGGAGNNGGGAGALAAGGRGAPGAGGALFAAGGGPGGDPVVLCRRTVCIDRHDWRKCTHDECPAKRSIQHIPPRNSERRRVDVNAKKTMRQPRTP